MKYSIGLDSVYSRPVFIALIFPLMVALATKVIPAELD